MKRKYIFSLAAAAIGSAALAVASAHAAWGFEHHGHHGSGVIRVCIAVMTPTEKAASPSLQSIFGSSGLKTDHQKVEADKEALAEAILGGSATASQVSGDETTLSTDEATLQTAEDSVATQVCGKLTPAELEKALALYKNLLKLRESTREQAHQLFENARP